MSREAETWARKQRTGNPVLKAVLVSLADWISPQNDWAEVSIRRLAEETEISARSVQRHIQTLVDRGFIEKAERYNAERNGARGWNAYRLVGFAELPLSWADPPRQSVTTPTTICRDPHDTPVVGPHDTAVSQPKPTQYHPQKGDKPPSSGRAAGSRLADAFEPKPLPPEIAAEVQAMPPGWLERELSRFRDFWTAKPGAAGRKSDWDATWRNWIRKAIDDAGGRHGRAAAGAGGYRRSVGREFLERAAAEHAAATQPHGWP